MDDSTFEDDPTIADGEELWRRIPPIWVIFDKNLDCFRPTSAAFDDSRNGTPMSVVIESVARATDRGPDDVLSGTQDSPSPHLPPGWRESWGSESPETH